MLTVQVEEEMKEIKKRNYSFMHRNQEGLDAADGWDKKEYLVPATPGTWYWAILKFCYENHDKPLRIENIVDGAAYIYAGRNPEKFEEYKAKDKIKTRKNGEPFCREANHWRNRVETNINTLTRHGGNNPYGQRLRERGHILRWESDHFKGEGALVLRTDTDEPAKNVKRKSRKKSNPNKD